MLIQKTSFNTEVSTIKHSNQYTISKFQCQKGSHHCCSIFKSHIERNFCIGFGFCDFKRLWWWFADVSIESIVIQKRLRVFFSDMIGFFSILRVFFSIS